VWRLRRALAEKGIPFDRKNFNPHITLVRKAVLKNGLPDNLLKNFGLRITDADLVSLIRSMRILMYWTEPAGNLRLLCRIAVRGLIVELMTIRHIGTNLRKFLGNILSFRKCKERLAGKEKHRKIQDSME